MILLMLSFVKLGCLFFCRSGLLPQEPFLDLPGITGRDLQEVARAKKSTAGGLDGWAWNEIKALPLPWFSGLAILLDLVETTSTWPQSLLDAFFAMIPKADGDSTPQRQRPLSVLPVVYRLWASLRLDICGSGLRSGYLSRCSVLVMVYLRWRPGSLLLWIFRRFFPGLVVISCMSWSLTSLSLLILLTGTFWTVLWVGWDCLTGFCKVFFFSFHSQVRLRLKLAAGLGEPWSRDGGIPQGCPLSMVFIVALHVPWCRHLDAFPDVKPQLYADNLKCSAERPGALSESARFTAQYVRSVGQEVSLLVSVSFSALLNLFGKL